MGRVLPGNSVRKRIREVNEIYDLHVKDGLSNREIWRHYVWPVYGISERTFYDYRMRDERLGQPECPEE